MEVEDHTALPTAPDERVVVSVIADAPTSGDGWRLRHATCLVVPTACAAMSWREWSARESVEQESMAGGSRLPATCQAAGDGWLLARAAPTADIARAWLAGVLDRARAAGAGGAFIAPELAEIPPLHAALSPPTSVVRAMPRSAGGAGNLVVGAIRPAMGVLWRAAHQPVAAELPGHVMVGGAASTWPSRDLSGIHLTPSTVSGRHQTPEGLFVGRLERRAWLIEQRGSREGDHTVARLSWDAEHVNPSGLMLQLEEYDEYGELALSQRISFADVELPELREGASAEVRLPTLGPKLRHGLSLYAHDGSLLDRQEPAPFVEAISLGIRTNDAPVIETTIGTPRPTPTLPERYERAAEVRETLAELGREGAEGRILRDRATGWPRLRRLLESARGELLIADPYFGQDEADWSLLEALSVPVRVLTCKVADVRAPIPPGVSARVRPKGTKVLHDRAYVWHQGGFLLGGSPSTIGHAPIAIMPLSPPEAELRALMFDALWASPQFRALDQG